MRLLQRSHGHRTLTDSHADGFAGEPHLIARPLEYAPLPFRRCHEPGFFAGDIDAREGAVAAGTHELVHAVDAERPGDPVEVHVAGLRDGMAHVDGSMLLVVPVLMAAAGQGED